MVVSCILALLAFWLLFFPFSSGMDKIISQSLTGTEIPGGWGRGRVCLTLHCHHQDDSSIKKGSDQSHFNVSLIVRDKDSVHKPQLLKRKESRS